MLTCRLLFVVFVIADLHDAYVWHFVKRSRHDARDGITVKIPAQRERERMNYASHRYAVIPRFIKREETLVKLVERGEDRVLTVF